MGKNGSVVLERVESFLLECFKKGISPLRYFSIEYLGDLIQSDSEELRSTLAKSLCYGDTRAVPLLVGLSRDEEELVRLEAIDSLINYPCEESYLTFCNGTNDESDLVRAYSFWGLSVASGEKYIHDARMRLRTAAIAEHDPRMLVDIYAGLYILGDKERLDDLMELFDEGNYLVKCAVIHTLEEIATEDNIDRLMLFLESKQFGDNGYAVSLTVRNVYHYLRSRF